MGRRERTKGARGELEAAKVLRQLGHRGAFRGRQIRGGPDSPDVAGVEGLHFEIKRVEKLNLWDAMEQAEQESALGEMPLVMFRRNHSPWLIALRAESMTDASVSWLRSLGWTCTPPTEGPPPSPSGT